MRITLNYKFDSVNSYVNKCRTNYYLANSTKQKETMFSALAFSRIKKIEKFPIELIFYWHIKTKTSDLDGRLPKNIIDGLVKSGRIPDDNVKYIQKITHIYIEDKQDFVEVEIKEMN